MKRKIITAAVIAAAFTTTVATGAHKYSTNRGFTDSARVTQVEPIYRTVTTSRPVRECNQHEVYRPVHYDEDRNYGGHHDSTLGLIVGGVLGGALGHNISRNHRDTAKVVGAVVGSAIGHEVASKHKSKRQTRHYNSGRHYDKGPRWEERCHTVNERVSEEKHDGYRVTYRYQGQTFTTRMDRDPGRQLKVRVKVTPVY